MHCLMALRTSNLLERMYRNGPNGADVGASVLTDHPGFSEEDEVALV